ncbi:MAG: GNAT family N-acetyltransferase [Tannerellaceae bacterium]|nr:GNAT family N-acetyltransferase [Tannerellaceae bacterium]
MIFLENDVIRLRALEPEDLGRLYKWENDTTQWHKGETVSPYSRYALKQFIAESHRGIYELKQLRMVVECKFSGEAIGMVDLYDFDAHNRRAGVGVLIDAIFQGRGMASQALDLLTRYAFGFLHLHQLYAYIAIDNEPSRKLFTKAGFTLSGVLTDWLVSKDGFTNVEVYQKVKS